MRKTENILSNSPLLLLGSDSFWEPGNYKRTTKWVQRNHLKNRFRQIIQQFIFICRSYPHIYNRTFTFIIKTSKFSGIVLRSGSYKHAFTFPSEPLSIHINLDLKQNFWYIDPWSRILTTVSVRPDLWSFILSSFFHSLIIQRALRFVVEVPLSSDVTAFTRCLKIPSCSLSFSFPHIFKVCSKKSKIVHKTKNQILHILSIIFNYIFGKTKNYILGWTQKHREGLCSVM